MVINRAWAMPNSNTFQIKPIKELIDKYAFGMIVDPFANNSKIATITNDLDEQYDTDYHMDAIDFLKIFNTRASYWSEQKKEIGRIVKPGGIAISFGWNSGGIGQKYGFEIDEILLVAHGGAHNDTIITVEHKR